MGLFLGLVSRISPALPKTRAIVYTHRQYLDLIYIDPLVLLATIHKMRDTAIKAYHFQLFLFKKTFFEASSSSFVTDRRIFLISNPFPIRPITRRATATNERIEFIGINISNLNLKKLGFQL